MPCPKCGSELDASGACPRCAQAAQEPLLPPPVATYTPMYTGMPGTVVARTSGMAIAALVLGIVAVISFGFLGFLGIFGLVFGIIALVQISSNRQQLQGTGLAVTGTVLSVVGMLLSLMILAGATTLWKKSPEIRGVFGNAVKAATVNATLQQGIQKFNHDTGVNPDSLKDLIAISAKDVKAKIKPGSYKGPYLRGTDGIDGTAIPKNPLVDPKDTNIEHHWVYDSMNGLVKPSQDHMALPMQTPPRHRF